LISFSALGVTSSQLNHRSGRRHGRRSGQWRRRAGEGLGEHERVLHESEPL